MSRPLLNVVQPIRLISRATFASSSRVRLDSTRVRLAEPSSEPQPRPSAESAASSPNPSSASTSRPTPAPAVGTTIPMFAIPALGSSRFSDLPQGSADNHSPGAPGQRGKKSPYRPSQPHEGRDTQYTLSVQSTRNNTMLTFSDKVGPLFPTISAGSDKTFKGAKRGEYEAAHQATLKMITKITEFWALGNPRGRPTEEGKSNDRERPTSGSSSRAKVLLAFKGQGGRGRDAVANALGGPDGVTLKGIWGRVEDRTPIKIGGTRARKPRRL